VHGFFVSPCFILGLGPDAWVEMVTQFGLVIVSYDGTASATRGCNSAVGGGGRAPFPHISSEVPMSALKASLKGSLACSIPIEI